MTPTPPDEPRIGGVEFDPPPPSGAEEVLDRGRRREQRLGPAALALAAVALVVGVLIGRWTAPDDTQPNAAATSTAVSIPPTFPGASQAPSVPPPESGQPDAVSLAAGRCARPYGTRQLLIGAQLSNATSVAQRLLALHVVLPMRGLRVVVTGLGRCDAGYPVAAVNDYLLAPRERVWLAIIVRPLERCPQPFPVQLEVTTANVTRVRTTTLDAFPDLGMVHWSRCPHG